MNEEKRLTGQEREDRIKELGKELDTLILTASEENFEGGEAGCHPEGV